MNGIFKNFSSEKTAFQQLPVGKQRMALIAVVLLDSSLNHDLTPKAADKQKPWKDVTPQMAITVKGIDNKGGMTHRLNGLGYKRWDDLTKAQQESGKFQNHEGYACAVNKQGVLTRIVDDTKTEQCKNILNEFCYAIGLEEGSKIDDIVAAAAEQKEFIGTVILDPYAKDKANYKLGKFRRVPAVVPASAGAAGDDFDE